MSAARSKKKKTADTRYVLCPANGYMHPMPVAIRVSYGPKGWPFSRCPHCQTKVFLPKDHWKAEDGLTRDEAEAQGCLVTQL